jgi:recombination protein RecA
MRGNRTRVTVVKNKMAPPFRKAEFDIMFNKGISREGEIIDMGVEKNIVDKSGTWLSFGGTRLGQGRDRACEFLAENPDVMAEIETKVRAAAAPAGVPAVPEVTADDADAPTRAAPAGGRTAGKSG